MPINLAQPNAPSPVTVLVLTPSVGGHYFGELVAGLRREVTAVGGRIVLVQTLDGGIRVDEESELSSFGTPVAWDQIDGAVSITTAAHSTYLQRLRDAGKPVVLASTRMPDFDAASALPDNHGGTFAAVEHLIAHGHTRIGFVGNLAQPDICDRYAAYVDALQAHDLQVDPTLVFATRSNDFDGGAGAARNVLACRRPPTALMVATDRNAIGLMRALAAAGLTLPRDLAIVGFDNMEEAAFSSPPLTSVDQRFGDVGALAGRLLLAQMRGEEVPFTAHVPPSSPLEIRGSCGCTADAFGTAVAGRAEARDMSPASVRKDVEITLWNALRTDHESSDLIRKAICAVLDGVERMHGSAEEISPTEIQWLIASMHRLATRPDVLRRVTSAVIAYLQRSAALDTAHHGEVAAANVWQLTTALWQMQAGAFLQQAETTRVALQEQYVVDAGMLTVGSADPRTLDWLAATHVRAGALALWTGDPSSRRLKIAGVYDPDGMFSDVPGAVTTAGQFPPQALIAAAGASARDVCIVIPVCTRDRERGLLAVVGQLDTTSAVEPYRQWATQLCASLEARELQEAVHESEQRYALAARASNDGLWEWNSRTQDSYTSDRYLSILGIAPRPGQNRRAQWLSLVHPEDRARVSALIRSVESGAQETGHCEYRVRTGDGSYRWMLSRVLGVPSLDGTIERVVGSLSDVHERHSLEEQLRENALFDELTGLPNRRMFLSRLEHAVALWNRVQTPFAVIFLDLDGFKAINDSLGHQMGDRVLNEVGARIEAALRDVDTGARFGGDEFAILLHDTDHDGVLRLAGRIQTALTDTIRIDAHSFVIGASFGVATSDIGYTAAEDVLRDADTAMYRAKGTNRGTVSFFDSAMHEHALSQLRLNAEIRLALDEHQFEMRYQPVVDLATGRADCFEALVRWRHTDRGLLMPDEFLPAMAESGAIVQLGHWIIDDVCRQLASWGPGVANVAVNVSDREFWHGDLLAHVQRSLSRHKLTADRLTLEITEGVIMRRPDDAVRLMRELHEAGLQLHIDDFGTGYSSLGTLHQFPVDAFKIDRSFIAGLTTGDRAEELVRAIVAMGKALHLDVVAEGIETTEQLQFLQRIGCATGQGFLFLPAVSAEHVPAVLRRVLGVDHSHDAPMLAAEPNSSVRRQLRAG